MRLPGPGDHPVSDLIFHGRHPFPASVERLILKIHEADPRAWREFASCAEGWTRLPQSDESCGHVVDYLTRMLHEMDRRTTHNH